VQEKQSLALLPLEESNIGQVVVVGMAHYLLSITGEFLFTCGWVAI